MVTNLLKKEWVEDVRYINRATKKEEFVSKDKRREFWSWNMGKDCFYTDNDGCGLWINNKQIKGTCQFSLFGYSKSGARKKINRLWSVE